ncbi:uncharacterized protein LOC126975550 [Leptidea sinapis]|uniref:uncharacterized protein LOC126975550 n=1 Tax=Leptidea sinapis TaxID=189913 RepID=UPI0021C30048|nr:uncharacterized protein LOC126975550 [Leptidea sinapis]
MASKRGTHISDSTPVKGSDPLNVSDSSGNIQHQDFKSFKNDVLNAMSKQEAHGQTLLKLIEEKFQAVQGSLDIFTDGLNTVKKDVADLKKAFSAKIEGLDSRITDLEFQISQISDIKTAYEGLKMEMACIIEANTKNEQWVRRSNIQINGIPQKKDEDLIKVITTLAEKSGYNLEPSRDIDFVTRVAVKNDVDSSYPKPIILKLLSRYKKDDFLACLRRLKELRASDIGFPGNKSRVFINDHLSSYNKMLLQKAKLRAKEKHYSYCWVRNCTVMVRQNDKSKIIHITSEDSLNSSHAVTRYLK